MYKYRFNIYGGDLVKLSKTRFEINKKDEFIIEGNGVSETIYEIDVGYKYGDDFVFAWINGHDDNETYILTKELDDIFKYLDKLKDNYTKIINYWKEFWEEDNE